MEDDFIIKVRYDYPKKNPELEAVGISKDFAPGAIGEYLTKYENPFESNKNLMEGFYEVTLSYDSKNDSHSLKGSLDGNIFGDSRLAKEVLFRAWKEAKSKRGFSE